MGEQKARRELDRPGKDTAELIQRRFIYSRSKDTQRRYDGLVRDLQFYSIR